MVVLQIILLVFIYLLILSLYTPIPFNDTGSVRYNSIPWMTLALIAINCALFVFWQRPEEVSGDWMSFENHLWNYASRRDFLVHPASIGAFTTFTGMFMHGNFFHLIGNMVFLWAFGRRVEDACGPWRYLIFYLLAGMVGTMAYFFMITDPYRGGVGASGAISGVMGAYMVLFPGARIGCLWMSVAIVRGIGIGVLRVFGVRRFKFKWLVYLPSFVVLFFYVFQDIIATIEAAETHELTGGVNYIAHAGGFLAGVTILLFVRKDLVVRYFAGRRL